MFVFYLGGTIINNSKMGDGHLKRENNHEYGVPRSNLSSPPVQVNRLRGAIRSVLDVLW